MNLKIFEGAILIPARDMSLIKEDLRFLLLETTAALGYSPGFGFFENPTCALAVRTNIF